MERYFRLLMTGFMLFCIGSLTVSCSSSGGGDGNTSAIESPAPPAPDPSPSPPDNNPDTSPVQGSNWDSMVWDQGKWG